MRIAEVILAPSIGGAHRLVAGLAEEWRSGGDTVDVISLDPLPADDGLGESLALSLFGGYETSRSSRNPRVGIKQLQRLRGLRRLLTPGYDVVHSHTYLPNLYTRLLAAASGAPPVVMTLHSSATDYDSALKVRIEKYLLRYTAAVVAVSESTARGYSERIGTHRHVEVVPNPITVRLKPREQVSDKPHSFLSTSRVSPVKDIVTLIRGFDRYLSLSNGSGTLSIAGPLDESEYAETVLAIHAKLRHRERIVFLGAQGDISALLEAADVFVHSALREEHSMSLLEAAAAGLPMITTTSSTADEELLRTSVSFAATDVAGLAAALSETERTWPQRARAAVAGAARIGARHALVDSAQRYRRILLSVSRVAASGPPSPGRR